MNQDKPQFVRQTQADRMKSGVMADNAQAQKSIAYMKTPEGAKKSESLGIAPKQNNWTPTMNYSGRVGTGPENRM